MHKLSKQPSNTKPPAAGKGKRRWSISRKEKDQHHVRTPSGKWVKTDVGLEDSEIEHSDDQRSDVEDAPQIPAWHLSKPPIRWDPHSRSRSDNNDHNAMHDSNEPNEHYNSPPAPVPFPMSSRKRHKPGSLYPMHNPVRPDKPYINWHLIPPESDLPPIFTPGYLKQSTTSAPDNSLSPPIPNTASSSAGGNSPTSIGNAGSSYNSTSGGQGSTPKDRSHPPTVQPHLHHHSNSVTALHQATSAILGHSTSHQSLHRYANSQDENPPPHSATLPRSTSETALNHMMGGPHDKKHYNYVAAPDPASLLDLTDAWGAQWNVTGPYDLGRRGPVKIPAILQNPQTPYPNGGDYHHATVPHQKRKPPTTGPRLRRPSRDQDVEVEGRKRKDSSRSIGKNATGGLRAMFYASTDDEGDNVGPSRTSHERQRTISHGKEGGTLGRPRGESTSESRLKPGSARPSLDIQRPSPSADEKEFEKEHHQETTDEEGLVTSGNEKTTTYNGRTVLSRRRTRSVGRDENLRANEPTRRPSQVGDRPIISHPTQLKKSPSTSSNYHASNSLSASQPPPHMLKALSTKKSYSHLGHGGVSDGISSLVQNVGPRIRKLSNGLGSGMGLRHKHSASLDHYHTGSYTGGYPGPYGGMGGSRDEHPMLTKRTSTGVLNKLAKKLSFVGGVVSGKTREIEEREIMMKERERLLREVAEKDRERERERERAISGVGAKPPTLGLGPGVGEKFELEEHLAGVSVEEEALKRELEERAKQMEVNEPPPDERRLPSDATTSTLVSSPNMSGTLSPPPSSHLSPHMSPTLIDPRSPGSRLSALRALQGQGHNIVPGTPPPHTIHSIMHPSSHHSPSVSSDDHTKSPLASIDTPFSPLGKFAALLSPKKPANNFSTLGVGDLMPDGGRSSFIKRSREPSPHPEFEVPERDRTESPVLVMPRMTLTVTNPDPEPDAAEIEQHEREEKERLERDKERRKKEQDAIEREKERDRLQRERERQEEEERERREQEKWEEEERIRQKEEEERAKREEEERIRREEEYEKERLRQELEEKERLRAQREAEERERERLRKEEEEMARRAHEEKLRKEREEERRRKEREEERLRKEREEERIRKEREEERQRRERERQREEEKLRKELEEERIRKEREEERLKEDRQRREREERHRREREDRLRREREEEREREEREREKERERAQRKRSSKAPSSTRQPSVPEAPKESRHERRASSQMQRPLSDPHSQPPSEAPGSPAPPPPPAKDYPPISKVMHPPHSSTSSSSSTPTAKPSTPTGAPSAESSQPNRVSSLSISQHTSHFEASALRESAIMSPVIGIMSPASTAIMSPVMGMMTPSATVLGIPSYGARASEIYGLGVNNGSGYLSVGYAIAPPQQTHGGPSTPVAVAYAVAPPSAGGSRSSDSLTAQNGIFTVQNGVMVVHPYGQQPPLSSYPPTQEQQSQQSSQQTLKSPAQMPHSPYPAQHYAYHYLPTTPQQPSHPQPQMPVSQPQPQPQQQRQPSPPRKTPPSHKDSESALLSNPLPAPPALVKSMSQREKEGLVMTSNSSSSSQSRKAGSSSSSSSKPSASSSSSAPPKHDNPLGQPSYHVAGRPPLQPQTASDPLTSRSSKHHPQPVRSETIPALGKQWESVVGQVAQRQQHKKGRSSTDEREPPKQNYVEYGGRTVDAAELEKIKEIAKLAKEKSQLRSSRQKVEPKASTVAPTPPPKNDVLPAIQVSKEESSPESSAAPTPPPKTPTKLPTSSKPTGRTSMMNVNVDVNVISHHHHRSDSKSSHRPISEMKVEADILALKAQEAFARDRAIKGTSLALDRAAMAEHIAGKPPAKSPEQRQSMASKNGRSSRRLSENVQTAGHHNQASHRQSYSYAPSSHLTNPMPRPPRDLSADLQAR
ncbi:hypothetical protein FRC03_004061 [Tulasnella sp. 419]|nr:hypothetical protein FRC03_004061 [Tulasnella sp. 419]